MFLASLLVDKTAPVLGTLTASPNPTKGAPTIVASAALTEANLLQAAEYWWGTTDPGVGKGTRVFNSTVANGNVSIPISTLGRPAGNTTLNVRVQDGAGNWSKAASTTVTIQPNLIFASGFEGTTPTDWSGRTRTGVANTTAAKMAGNRGLAVTANGATQAYVTDTKPAAENTYHASFQFNRNTLTNGTATALTIFEGRSGITATSGNQVFAIQFRMAGTQAQLRLQYRSGATTVAGAWVNLASGAHRFRWTTPPASGRATGRSASRSTAPRCRRLRRPEPT